MPKLLLTLTIIALLAFARTASAHEHKVMGTVTMTGTDHVMMKTTDGHAVTVTITKDTKITKGKETVKADVIKEGTRLVVTTASEETPYTAMAIEVGVVVKTPAGKRLRTPTI